MSRENKIIVMLALLMIGMASCNSGKSGVKRGVAYPKGGEHSQAIKGATDSGWATLDIKLTADDNRRLYREIKDWLGTPYRYAGADKSGADCSGFVMMVYKTVYGKSLQRNSARMYQMNCKPLKRRDLREGDLVFFNNGRGGGINHVGIYLKDGKFAHTSSSRGVMISDLNDIYFSARFYAGGRVV